MKNSDNTPQLSYLENQSKATVKATPDAQAEAFARGVITASLISGGAGFVLGSNAGDILNNDTKKEDN